MASGNDADRDGFNGVAPLRLSDEFRREGDYSFAGFEEHFLLVDSGLCFRRNGGRIHDG